MASASTAWPPGRSPAQRVRGPQGFSIQAVGYWRQWDPSQGHGPGLIAGTAGAAGPADGQGAGCGVLVLMVLPFVLRPPIAGTAGAGGCGAAMQNVV